MIGLSKPSVGDREIAAVTRVLKSGWLTGGKLVSLFERELEKQTGWDHAVCVNSATMAFSLTLDYLKVGPASELVFPDLTFCSMAVQAARRGAKIYVVDVDPKAYCMSLSALPVGVRKRAWLVPTDYAGYPVEVDIALMGRTLHDAAAFIGDREEFRGRAAFVSFYANKPLTTGEGGALLTNDAALAKWARKARLHGIATDIRTRNERDDRTLEYDVEFLGQKATMTDIAAAMGLEQIERLKYAMTTRQYLVNHYAKILGEADRPVRFQMQHQQHSNCFLPLVFEDRKTRDRVQQALCDHEIGCSLHYPLLSSLTALKNYDGMNFYSTPVATKLVSTMLSVPLHPEMDLQSVEEVCAVIKKAI